MCRLADYTDSVFGKGKKIEGCCGHPEIELALVKLYETTGKEKYLDLSRYFLDERGRTPNCFRLETKRSKRASPSSYFCGIDYTREADYSIYQAHIPVREQKKAAGHAVRAGYLYSGMADVAREAGDKGLFSACKKLFEDITEKKMYLTGGIGSTNKYEKFTSAYDLPNETAYAETCAAVSLIFFAHRMLKLDCDSRYSDCVERVLFNGSISGVSLDGKKFFYENRLASNGSHHRQDGFPVSCCPANIARLIASVGDYIYSYGEDEIVIHQYIASSTSFYPGNNKIKIVQKTNYPWDNTVSISVDPEQDLKFCLKIRKPGWCEKVGITVNGRKFKKLKIEKGYISIGRKWKSGDKVLAIFSMPVEKIYANPEISQDTGLAALQRGPIVYCFEETDNNINVVKLQISDSAKFKVLPGEGVLKGMKVLKGKGLISKSSGWKGLLYRSERPEKAKKNITAIPYFAWDNRKTGSMSVWMKTV